MSFPTATEAKELAIGTEHGIRVTAQLLYLAGSAPITEAVFSGRGVRAVDIGPHASAAKPMRAFE